MAYRSMQLKVLNRICVFFALVLLASHVEAKVTKSVFGSMPDGTKVEIFTLEEGSLKARVMTYGARLVSLEVPDRSGKISDIVLGYESLDGYTADPKSYFGSIVGRYGNRIAHATFTLDGKRYDLPANDGVNTLHGGIKGFDKLVWKGQEIPHGVELTLVSKDGDQGFPGTLTARVRYTLEAHALKIEYFATTDKDTVLNLTNHSYFNLAGEGQGDILNHLVIIPADRYTPVDSGLIPTGELAPVAGTPLDFHKATAIGARIDDPNEQMRLGGGYDHNFVLNGKMGVLQEAARVVEPTSGRVLTVETTQPGVQFYSGNFLDGTLHGKHGHVYAKHTGFCLETQHFPDSPNHPKFPTSELKPGETYHSVTFFKFSTAP
ncbi:MAG: aldose epimerase family protein [Acidobacteriaceae bacterium]|jgi:aldose 1-epimerase